jgi:hypothetical protein
VAARLLVDLRVEETGEGGGFAFEVTLLVFIHSELLRVFWFSISFCALLPETLQSVFIMSTFPFLIFGALFL